MALAQVQYTQVTLGERNFTVPFQYISRDHVIVSVNGLGVAFTWLNPTTVRLAVAPQLNDIIDLSRKTERNNLLVTFNDGSTLTEGQLVLAAKQTFFIAQEAFDATGGTLSVKADGSYSAAGRRIRDLGAPTADGDATTRKWVMDQYTSGKNAEVARIAAVAAELKAKKWADNAENVTVETGKYSSKHHAIKANASAVSASASLATLQAAELTATQKASEASASASAAATSATGAATSATASQASRVASDAAKVAAEAAKVAAIGAKDTSLAYRDQTLTYRDTANSHKTAAETARNVTLGYRNTAGDHAAAAATARTGAESARNTADTHRLNAAASATAAAGSATTANVHKVAAAGSAAEAAGYAAGLNMPSALGGGGQFLRQNLEATGLEYVNLDWALLQNTPATFPPSAHTHHDLYYQKSEFGTESVGNTPVIRDTSGDIRARLFRSTYTTTNSSIGCIYTSTSTAGTDFIRPSTPAQLQTALGLGALAVVTDGLRITNGANGNVVIGNRNTTHTHYTSSTGSHYFYGTVTCAGNITAYSDRRVKDDLQVIPDALDKVSQLSGYTFERTDVDTPRQTGVIAQEVLAVLPEAVAQDKETGHYHVAYGNMVGLLIEAVKELKGEVAQLKEKLNGAS